MDAEHILHTIEPVFDGRSRVLVLGTMPSPRSREVGFYYCLLYTSDAADD